MEKQRDIAPTEERRDSASNLTASDTNFALRALQNIRMKVRYSSSEEDSENSEAEGWTTDEEKQTYHQASTTQANVKKLDLAERLAAFSNNGCSLEKSLGIKQDDMSKSSTTHTAPLPKKVAKFTLSPALKTQYSVLLLNALSAHPNVSDIFRLVVPLNNAVDGFMHNSNIVFGLIKRAIRRIERTKQILDTKEVFTVEQLIIIANNPNNNTADLLIDQTHALIPNNSPIMRDTLNQLILVLSTLKATEKSTYGHLSQAEFLLILRNTIINRLPEFFSHSEGKNLALAMNMLHQMTFYNTSNPEICYPLKNYRDAYQKYRQELSLLEGYSGITSSDKAILRENKFEHVKPHASVRFASPEKPDYDDFLSYPTNELLEIILSDDQGDNVSQACFTLAADMMRGENPLFNDYPELIISLVKESWMQASDNMRAQLSEQISVINNPLIRDAVLHMTTSDHTPWIQRASALCQEISQKNGTRHYPLNYQIKNAISILKHCKSVCNHAAEKGDKQLLVFFNNFIRDHAPASVAQAFAIDNYVHHGNSNARGYTSQFVSPENSFKAASSETSFIKKSLQYDAGLTAMAKQAKRQGQFSLTDFKAECDKVKPLLQAESAVIQKFVITSLLMAFAQEMTTETIEDNKIVYKGPHNAVRLMEALKIEHKFPTCIVDSKASLDTIKLDLLWDLVTNRVTTAESGTWRNFRLWNSRSANTDQAYKMMKEIVDEYQASIARSQSQCGQ